MQNDSASKVIYISQSSPNVQTQVLKVSQMLADMKYGPNNVVERLIKADVQMRPKVT